MLPTTLQLRILALFFAHRGEEFYMSEVGEAIGKQPGAFQRAINSLENQGVLTSRRRGNQRVFAVNAEYPFLKELKAIVDKSVGIERDLRNALAALDQVSAAVIYGSYAKDALGPNSDVDLLVVVEDPEVQDALVEMLQPIEKRIRREINYRLYTNREFCARKKKHDSFLARVVSEAHIVLKGAL